MDVHMETRRGSKQNAEAWRIATTVNFCLAKVVGKYAAYPEVDLVAFKRVHDAVEEGLERLVADSLLGDFCQELRSVISCHVAELLRPEGADEIDARITAIAQVVRVRTGLNDALFREILEGLLSWEPCDKQLILDALTGIING
jgi:hypothetical protein